MRSTAFKSLVVAALMQLTGVVGFGQQEAPPIPQDPNIAVKALTDRFDKFEKELPGKIGDAIQKAATQAAEKAVEKYRDSSGKDGVAPLTVNGFTGANGPVVPPKPDTGTPEGKESLRANFKAEIEGKYIGAIKARDGDHAHTARKALDELDLVLKGSDASKLESDIEAGFTRVANTLAQDNVPGRSAWLDAHEAIKSFARVQTADETNAQEIAETRKVIYGFVRDRLHLLASADTPVAPSDSILPARFWMDNALESGLYRFDQDIRTSSSIWANRLKRLASSQEPSAKRLIELSLREQEDFLNAIREGRTEMQYGAWRRYLIEWRNALQKMKGERFNPQNVDHLRMAFRQASEQVAQMGQEVDAQHHKRAMENEEDGFGSDDDNGAPGGTIGVPGIGGGGVDFGPTIGIGGFGGLCHGLHASRLRSMQLRQAIRVERLQTPYACSKQRVYAYTEPVQSYRAPVYAYTMPVQTYRSAITYIRQAPPVAAYAMPYTAPMRSLQSSEKSCHCGH